MPIPLFNSIASWILKKRIHQMELFMKYPNEVQNELLHELIKTASKTEIGKLVETSGRMPPGAIIYTNTNIHTSARM